MVNAQEQATKVEDPKISAIALLKKREERTNKDEEEDAKEQYMSYELARLAAFNTTPAGKFNLQDSSAMLERAKNSCQLLVQRLFALPSEPAEFGRLAELPPPLINLPREKPTPKPKSLTRWEKFAKEKGIQTKKKDRMVFDEQANEWRPTWGYKKASNAEKDLPPIMEAGPKDDGSSDPFTKKEMEKKENLQKQKNREKRNLAEEEIHGKTHLQLSENPSKQEQKLQTKAQLKLAQKSTGSLGKFDKKLKGELKSLPNRKFDPETMQNEKKRNLELLSKIVSVEGATLDHDKAANKGLGSVSFMASDRPAKKAKAGSQKKDKGKKPKRNAKAKR